MARSGGLGYIPFVAAAAVAVVGIGLAVFLPHADSSLKIVNQNNSRVGKALENVALGKPYRFVTYPLCVAHGAVTITSVTAHGPADGIKVSDWALGKATPSGSSGGAPGKATQLPGFTASQVTAPCSKPQVFAVSVLRTADVGSADGFEVDSTSGSIVVPYSVLICAKTCPNSG